MNSTDNEKRALGALKVIRAQQALHWENTYSAAPGPVYGTLTQLGPASAVFPDFTSGYHGYEFETGPCRSDHENFWILAHPKDRAQDRLFFFTHKEGRVFVGTTAVDLDAEECVPPEGFEELRAGV